MNREQVIKFATEAGFAGTASQFYMKALERFAALVAAAEREACAKVCEKQFAHYDGTLENCFETPAECAAAIRARGEE